MKAAPLAIPEEVLEQHVISFGKTGAGKSSTLRHLVENRISLKKRVCIIDPKGDWWGLPSSADGKGPGFPVVLFGDFRNDRSDVPMDARAGKELAQIIASSDQAMVLGFRGWMPADLTRFWLDFAPALFNLNRGELYLVIDEVHNFAPKAKILSPDSGKMLHWTNRLAAEGRGIGLKILMASQRPQKVHNDTASCCETMIAMRVTHPRDRAALKEWMDECGEPAKGKDVLAEVSSMRRGQAWVWFPAGDYLEKVQFPMFKSFDSFSERATDPPKTWAKVDVGAVREKLARVVKEQEDNDPRKLRAEIAIWKKTVENMEKIQSIKVSEEDLRKKYATRVEVPVFSTEDRAAMDALRISIEKATERASARSSPDPGFPAKSNQCATAVLRAPGGTIRPRQESNGFISGGKRRMMIALAQRPGLNARQLGARAGLSSSSGSFGTYLSWLRSEGYLEGHRDSMSLTREGIAALGSYEPLPTGRALLDYWTQELGNGGASRILSALAEAYPKALPKAALGEKTGLSYNSGSFGTYLSKLRTLELISGSHELKASEELFD